MRVSLPRLHLCLVCERAGAPRKFAKLTYTLFCRRGSLGKSTRNPLNRQSLGSRDGPVMRRLITVHSCGRRVRDRACMRGITTHTCIDINMESILGPAAPPPPSAGRASQRGTAGSRRKSYHAQKLSRARNCGRRAEGPLAGAPRYRRRPRSAASRACDTDLPCTPTAAACLRGKKLAIMGENLLKHGS